MTSISKVGQQSELTTAATGNYYIACSLLFQNQTNGDIKSQAMRQYYQLKVNSILDPSQHDIEYICNKLANSNVYCIRCGSLTKLRLINRKSRNKSEERKYCKYLKNLCERYCDKCFKKSKINICDIPTATSQPRDKVDQPSKPDQVRQNHPLPKTATATKKQQHHQLKPKPAPKPKQTPQFSSKLRAFSCLLEK